MWPQRAWPLLGALAVAGAQSPAPAQGSTGAWHYVDVQKVVCPGQGGWTVVNISAPPGDVHHPHIFTLFRTSKQAVTVHFDVRDAAGKVVAEARGTTLQALSGRRLRSEPAAGAVGDTLFAASSSSTPERRLSSRRRSGGSFSAGSSYSAPRRRSSTYYSPRRRGPISPVGSPRRRGSSGTGSPRRRSSVVGTPRRRVPSSNVGTRRRTSNVNFNAPRRRGYVQSGVRRRTYGVQNSRYNNPHSPGSGYYGYTNQRPMYNNFGGRPPMMTPYGYSGANAYRGHSGARIVMALAGGVAAGVAGSYLFHHWGSFRNLFHMNCFSGSWTGNCHSCTSLFAASSCFTSVSPSFNAARDDLMDTGFVPADYTFPLYVNVSGVQGVSFLPTRICPPPGWTPEMNATWSPPDNESIFITLTAMAELGTPADGGGGGGGGGAASSDVGLPLQHALPDLGGSWLQIALGILVVCCAVPALLRCCCRSRQSRRRKPHYYEHDSDSSSSYSGSSDDTPPQHYGHQVSPMPNYATGGFSTRGGFMASASPSGRPWMDYCRGEQVVIDSPGIVAGRWGECLAWAKVYELNNPSWENDPQYRDEGPCGQVVAAMLEASPYDMRSDISEAAERLEDTCASCAERGQPMPLIGWRP
mmetsp:Transcript_41068/g.129299  ORF Transcript_41068/g.129299 Transcript_41068/m.129299 type:complete len:640 (-) Transcript_41068:152-2071(-)